MQNKASLLRALGSLRALKALSVLNQQGLLERL